MSTTTPDSVNVITKEGFLLHNVGTLKPSSGKRLAGPLPGLDTPSLLGAWEYESFLHDGSAATLMDVITIANLNDRHGKTSQLTETEKNQLVAFLQQIDGKATPMAIIKNHFREGLQSTYSLQVRALSGGLAVTMIGSAETPELELFNTKGLRVKKMIINNSSRIDATHWSVFWNGKDNAGLPVHRGVYFFQAKFGNTLVQKSIQWSGI